MQIQKPNIFNYFDYRRFLSDAYLTNKKQNPAFSHRYFARLAGLKSFNYLKLIFDGKRRLTPTFFEQFSRVLGLTPTEKKYFSKMVAFSEEEDSEKKNLLFDELLRTRPKTPLTVIENGRLKVCKEWYYIPLIELTGAADFKNDYHWMGKRLGLSGAMVKRAVSELLACGMLKINGRGLEKTDRLADTPDEISSFLVKTYHQKNLMIASKKVMEQDVHEREFGSVTFVADESKIKALKEKIKRFRKEIFELLEKPSGRGIDVYQLNVQMFRVTERGKTKQQTEKEILQ